jgi:hypothetical protein
LVREVARSGRGSYYFVEENENLKAKVIGALKKATAPSLKNCSINWSLGKSATGIELEAPAGRFIGEIFRN